MRKIKWPEGKQARETFAAIRRHKAQILNGKTLVIDPASGGSSLPGFALIEGGVIVKSGVFLIRRVASLEARLNALVNHVDELKPGLVVVEKLRGKMVHPHLWWSVGAIVAAGVTTIELPIQFWKVVAPPGYVKSDKGDAELMAKAVLMLAKGETDVDSVAVSVANAKAAAGRRARAARA